MLDVCDNCETTLYNEIELVTGVCEECQVEEDAADEEYDGQPDEMQEWHDFDPDC